MLLSLREFLLLQLDQTDSPPNLVILLIIDAQALFEVAVSSFSILDGDVLKSAVAVSQAVSWVDLDCSFEEFDRCFMLVLERVAVSDYDPGLWSKEVDAQSAMAQMNELDLFLLSPETCGIRVQTFSPERFDLDHLLEDFLSFDHLLHLDVDFSNLGQDPTSFLMVLRQRVECFQSFLIFVL